MEGTRHHGELAIPWNGRSGRHETATLKTVITRQKWPRMAETATVSFWKPTRYVRIAGLGSISVEVEWESGVLQKSGCPRFSTGNHEDGPSDAKVAELADAPDLGSGGREPMGVRVPPFAPFLFNDLRRCGGSGTSPLTHLSSSFRPVTKCQFAASMAFASSDLPSSPLRRRFDQTPFTTELV